jgi:hypothetical protein
MKKEYTRLTTQDNLSFFATFAFVTVVIAAIVITLFVFPILVLIPIVAGSAGTPLLYLLWIKKIEDQKDKLGDSLDIEKATIRLFTTLSIKSRDLNNVIQLKIDEKTQNEGLIQFLNKSIVKLENELKKPDLPDTKKGEIEGGIARYKNELADADIKRETLDNEILRATSADSTEVMYVQAKIKVLETELASLKNSTTPDARNTIKISHLQTKIAAITEILNGPTNVASNFAVLVEEGKI